MMLDVAEHYPARLQADVHALQDTDAARTFGHRAGRERTVPIPWLVQDHVAQLGAHCLQRRHVTRVA